MSAHSNVSIEINPRQVLDSMDDDQLAVHLVTAASVYYHRRVRALGHTSPEIHAFGAAINAFYPSIDAIAKAVKP